ncbi:AAA domain-containing protein [Bdellovibrio sp. NC01]|uniref:AAA domain-containing protein n=1 Tax=Bdellovibrio sp. NC01 TaxID=2220073 RepID=UPI00115B6FD3|nr:AAA domain-containing protein [Bdellovibrio sp. NC01]QDK38450.1 hypothetical protein DOE51_13125 [Bdellovibrio sp. NC01]
MSDSSSYLQRQLKKHKDLLANLSRRNRELYYKESNSSSINLTRSPFSESVMIKDKEGAFIPARICSGISSVLKSEIEMNLNEHFRIESVTDGNSVKKFYSKIDKVRLTDDRHQREFGISGAWILGPFLCWRTSNQVPKEDLLISPIFKVAVDLKKNKKKHLILKAEDNDLSFNPSLLLALKQNFGFEVPEDIEFENIENALDFFVNQMKRLDRNVVFASNQVDRVPDAPSKFKILKDADGEIIERIPIPIEEALSQQDLEIYNQVTGHNFVLVDAFYLDQLSASRMVLIKDYDQILEDEKPHPILNELFNGSPLAEKKSDLDRNRLKELDAYKERENYFVVDIDSTQHRAIDQATKSNAIVIQGPPGTGKSQTIVNLIADYLAKGKKVLFVSEKRPALDVVYNRMRSARIDEQAVLIHSSDLNKSDLYKSFLSLANSSPSEVSEKEWLRLTDDLDNIKQGIHQYADALVATHFQSGLQAAELLVAQSQMDSKKFHPNLIPHFAKFNYEQIRYLSTDIDLIQEILEACPDFEMTGWKYRRYDVIRTNSLERELRDLKMKLLALEDEKVSLDDILSQETGELAVSEESFNKILGTVAISACYTNLWSQKRNDMTQVLDATVANLKLLQAKLEKNQEYFYSIAPNSETAKVEELELYYSIPRGFTDWFTSAYWINRKLRNIICPVWNGTTAPFKGYLEYLAASEDLCTFASSFISQDLPDKSDYKSLNDWIVSQIERLQSLKAFFSSCSNNALPAKMMSEAVSSLEGFNRTISNIEKVRMTFVKLRELHIEVQSLWDTLGDLLTEYPKPLVFSERILFLDSLISSIDSLETIDKADIYTDKLQKKFGIDDLKSIINNHLSAIKGKWSSAIEATMLFAWADDLIRKSPELRAYTREGIHKLIEEFKVVSEAHKNGSQSAVHQAFARRWSQESDRSGLPLLKREAEKQNKVLSPREIMERGALETMLQLKPCWLMSPLSISQMLPLRDGLFDVIIFDEASQVRVEDAIPSIYRAKTMIVVGDNKQMPPTNFFAGGVIDDEDDDIEIASSVLDLACQVFPEVLLEWHYRSKAESLIAFSNRAFYGGRLIAVPNPTVLASSGAIRFEKIEKAFFTAKDGNLKEAERLVRDLINLLKVRPDQSYGIIAMGQRQAVAIDEVIEMEMEKDPATRKLIEAARAHKDGEADAGLFVKNLENVQGDERDVILMSVGYAPTEEGKKLKQNFGPLGKKGGGRRLNVAITRAKAKMHVYCSFDPSEIPSDVEAYEKNPDACTFGKYLIYAKAISEGDLERALHILNSFSAGGVISGRKSSRFALDVKRRLEENGHKVTAEIGASGFFIDLGIHDNVVPNTYKLGIECDGAIFHSTPYARDRDKIRESLLRSRGWKIERIWSQDWSKDWRKEIIRIEKALLISNQACETNGESQQEPDADSDRA